MDTFIQWVERLATVATTPAQIGLFVALGIMLMARRWPLQVLGMALMYGVVGILHARIIRPEVVLVKLLVGLMVCLAMAATGRSTAVPSVDEERDETRSSLRRGLFRGPFRVADDVPLRGGALLAAFVIAYAGSVRFPLPQVPFLVSLACYLLAVVGLFLAGMSEEPLPVGLGLLAFLNGFDLFFGALEPSLVVAGLLGMVQLLVTLAVAHLALSRETTGEKM